MILVLTKLNEQNINDNKEDGEYVSNAAKENEEEVPNDDREDEEELSSLEKPRFADMHIWGSRKYLFLQLHQRLLKTIST